MKKKRFLIPVLVSALVLGLTACGGGSGSSSSSAQESPEERTEESTEQSTEEVSESVAEPSAPAESTAAPEETGEIHIGFGYLSSDTINKTILENMATVLKEEGIILDLAENFDSETMYLFLSQKGSGIDMAFCNPGDKYDTSLLQPAGYTATLHYRLYSTNHTSVDEITEDDRIGLYLEHYQSSIRIQKILEAAGIITLPNGPSVPLDESAVELHVAEISTGTDYNAIFDNLRNLGAALLPGTVMSYEYIFDDPTFEDPQFWGTILVRSEDLADPAMREAFRKVVEAYQSDFTAMTLFQDSYAEPVGWDTDLLGQ